MVVHGMKQLAMGQLVMDILKFYSGHMQMVVHGTKEHAVVQLRMDILQYYNGPLLMTVHGIQTRVRSHSGMVMQKCCIG
jgi:hypothetical protein